MRDMARMLVEQRLMSADEAEQAVRMFLARLARRERMRKVPGRETGKSRAHGD